MHFEFVSPEPRSKSAKTKKSLKIPKNLKLQIHELGSTHHWYICVFDGAIYVVQKNFETC